MLKIYLILSVCFGTLLLANCGGNQQNSNTNKPTANSSNTNRVVNAPANSTDKSPTPVAEKSASAESVAGNWESEEFNKKGDKYTRLSLMIEQKGENVSGIYSVVDYIGKEPQIEDGNQTPFAGIVKNNVATIKFDPDATVPGYEENVKYKEPASGKPATATLTISGNSLEWKLTSGSSPFDIPRDIKLNKAK